MAVGSGTALERNGGEANFYDQILISSKFESCKFGQVCARSYSYVYYIGRACTVMQCMAPTSDTTQRGHSDGLLRKRWLRRIERMRAALHTLQHRRPPPSMSLAVHDAAGMRTTSRAARRRDPVHEVRCVAKKAMALQQLRRLAQASAETAISFTGVPCVA